MIHVEADLGGRAGLDVNGAGVRRGSAGRALLSAEGYQVERALAVLDQWMEDAAKRAAS
jgi:hypothetical protein